MPPFIVNMPARRQTSVVFASPHSGREYQAAFGNTLPLSENLIRSSEDAFVDQLFAAAPRLGAPLLTATMPRAYLDLNRAADELDPALIQGIRRVAHNPRISSGLGVIPRVVAGGRTIYTGKITLAEAHARIRDVWRPYHDKLQALLDQSQSIHGESILIDCHSMPREALDVGRLKGERPEIVIGDRFGASASARLVERISDAFTDAGFRVAHNSPFAGAFSVTTYGRPSRRQHAVQIEIDRSLYMNEKTIEALPNFGDMRERLEPVIAQLIDLGASHLPLAAE